MNFEIVETIQLVTTILLVLATIIAWRQLAEMMRQSGKIEMARKASAYQEMIQYHTESRISMLLPYPDLLKWHLGTRGIKSEGTNRDRIKLYALVKIELHENMYLRHLEGALSEEPWAAWKNVIEMDFSIDVYQDLWKHVGQFYAPSFRLYIDRFLNQVDPAGLLTTRAFGQSRARV